MERVILARHALASSNRDGTCSYAAPGLGLTPEGVEQARRLGELVADDPIDLGVVTELLRTRETLELALEGRELPIVVVPELNEIHFGSFDGGLLDRYREWAWTEQPAIRPPGDGESRAEAAARYARGLRVLLARPERVALVVAHALAVRYVLDAAEGLAPAARMTPVEHAVPFRLDARDVEAAARLLEDWSAEPRFREPTEGSGAQWGRDRVASRARRGVRP
jgi:broad specificity phosphatase PhoE